MVDARYYYLAFQQEIGSEGELRLRGFDNDRRHTSAATRAERELSEAIKQTRMAVLKLLKELD